MNRKIIIDTDPGIDDAMAIFFAFAAPQLDVLGLTTTFGNVSVEMATQNAITLTEIAGVNVPVATGVAVPLEITPRAYPDFVHGADGFGNIGWPAPKGKALDISAAQFIIDTVRANPGEVTIIALAPLGNLATALQMDPEIADLVDEVILMGGAAAEYGNVSPVAEANIINDPHAADIVFTANWQVTMIGLDVTHQVVLSNALFNQIRDENPKVGSFMHQAAQFYIKFYSSIRDIDGCYGHDISAVAYVIDPTLFGTESGEVCVATEGVAIGQTIMSRFGIPYPLPFWQDRPKQKACMTVDDQRLLALFRDAMVSDFWSN